MDTLGSRSIAREGWGPRSSQEPIERLRYLARISSCGALLGPAGAGKSDTFSLLADELRREGLPTLEIDLTAMSGTDVAMSLAGRLGLGVDAGPAVRLWASIQDHAESARQTHSRLVVLLDHVDAATDDAAAALRRLINLFGSTAAWLFAGRPEMPAKFQRLLADCCWLRVEMGTLGREDAAEILERDWQAGQMSRHMTDDGIDAAFELARGRIDRLRHLAMLAEMAAEADGLPQINGDLVRSVAGEFAG